MSWKRVAQASFEISCYPLNLLLADAQLQRIPKRELKGSCSIQARILWKNQLSLHSITLATDCHPQRMGKTKNLLIVVGPKAIRAFTIVS